MKTRYNRRRFLRGTGALIATTACATTDVEEETSQPVVPTNNAKPTFPVVISTWKHGIEANAGAWTVLGESGSALDAVENGVKASFTYPVKIQLFYSFVGTL